MSGFSFVCWSLPPFFKYMSKPSVKAPGFASKIVCNCYECIMLMIRVGLKSYII